MYNYSGIWYRIWGVCGVIFLLGVVCILFGKPWCKGFASKIFKIGLFTVIFALIMGGIYLSRIVSPNIASFSGEFIGSYRDSRVAPPLPLTSGYRFLNGDDPKRVFYLDVFSEKSIFDSELQSGETYTVYYDTFTKVIVGIDSPLESG